MYTQADLEASLAMENKLQESLTCIRAMAAECEQWRQREKYHMSAVTYSMQLAGVRKQTHAIRLSLQEQTA